MGEQAWGARGRGVVKGQELKSTHGEESKKFTEEIAKGLSVRL